MSARLDGAITWSGKAESGAIKCCSDANCDCVASCCEGLRDGQSIFSNPESCDALYTVENIQCPPGTHLMPNIVGTSPKTKNLKIPICVGVQSNCYPREILSELQKGGIFNDINIDKNVMNCDVYNKVYVQRIVMNNDYETTISKDV
jgi:hypothetical protein